jgi:hypothetical protein
VAGRLHRTPSRRSPRRGGYHGTSSMTKGQRQPPGYADKAPWNITTSLHRPKVILTSAVGQTACNGASSACIQW